MSKYTYEIMDLINADFDLGLKDYPIFDEAYRTHLNNKILNRYMFYEIGQETPEKFKFMLNARMDLIMPQFNEMYKTTLWDINPLISFEREHVDEKTNVLYQENEANTDMTKNLTSLNTSSITDNSTVENDTTLNSTDTSTVISTNVTDTTRELNDATSINKETSNVQSANGKNKTIGSDTPADLLTSDITDGFGTNVMLGENEDTVVNTTSDKNSQITDTNETNHSSNTMNTTTENTNQTIGNNDTVTVNRREATENKADDETNNIKNQTSTTSTTTETLKTTERGTEVPFSKLINDYRSTLINVDIMVIESLSDLFLMIY